MNKIIFTLLIIISFSARAQYFNQTNRFLKANSVWTFGDSSGLDFNNGGPLPITTALFNNKEGCASVADSAGNLLFYMGNNGIIYNRNHLPMLNGTGIYPRQDIGSSMQGALIVPVIDTPWKYYAFTNAENSLYENGAPPPYLAYSVVDMTLDNGLGGVETGRKNIPLDSVDVLGEGMIAIPGDNCDIWLITYVTSHISPLPNNSFKAWNISAAGIDPNPVLSHQPFNGAFGSLAVSPDRQKVAVSFALHTDISMSAGTVLCRFDPATGRVFDSIFLERYNFDPLDYQFGVTSACFSPDNTKLYLNVYRVFFGSFIEQLDITTYNQAAIQASASRVDTGISVSYHYDLKLYNDTIYTISGESSGFSFIGTHLSQIVNPNADGPACGFKHKTISLPRLQYVNVTSLPNPVVFPIQKEGIIHKIFNTTICKNQSSVLKAPDNFYDYEWDSGDTSETRIIGSPGIYWVKYYDSKYADFRCDEYVDTFVVDLIELDPTINVNVFDLSTTISYKTYQWLLNGQVIPGATNKTYSVTENGDYSVVVSNENDCIDTSEVYTVNNWTSVPDIHIMAQYVHVFPNPASNVVHIKSLKPVHAHLCGIDGRSLVKVTDAIEVPLSALPDGLYLLRILDKEGRLIKIEKIRKQQP